MHAKPIRICGWIIALAFASALALAAPPRFTGEFQGDELKVEFQEHADGSLRGTIEFDDLRLPARAELRRGRLVGTFTHEGERFDFTFEHLEDEDAYILVSDGARYTLARQPGPREVDREPTPRQRQGDTMTIFNSLLGFQLEVPRDWQVVHASGGAQLIPGDAAKVQGNLVETLAFAWDAVAEVTRPDAPQILAGLDQGAAAWLHNPRRVGGIERVEAHFPSIRITYEGAGQDGHPLRISAWVAIINNRAAYVTLIGHRDAALRREAEALALFQSLRPLDLVEARRGLGPVDRRIVGVWELVTGGTGDQFVSMSSTRWELRADGTFTQVRSSMSGISGEDADTSRTITSGRWGVQGTTLQLRFDDGTVADAYFASSESGLGIGRPPNRRVWSRIG